MVSALNLYTLFKKSLKWAFFQEFFRSDAKITIPICQLFSRLQMFPWILKRFSSRKSTRCWAPNSKMSKLPFRKIKFALRYERVSFWTIQRSGTVLKWVSIGKITVLVRFSGNFSNSRLQPNWRIANIEHEIAKWIGFVRQCRACS